MISGLIQTTKVSQQISLTVVELGENVTLHCPVAEKDDRSYWYKLSLGHMAQTVAAVIFEKITITEQFKDPRFTVTKKEAQSLLTIRNVSKEDEATYFCQTGTTFSLTSGNWKQQKSVHVKQSPETASVQLGDPMTLQCSLLSKNKETRVQCPGEHSVHWFRAGSGGSHPGIIYTQRNRSDEEEERSCVYNLSKTIQDSSDSGTYYLETKLDPSFLVLGVLLVCCVTVIAVLILSESKHCEHCKGWFVIFYFHFS
uniref:Ig-like domain-containing protein n=1 Tax=Lates calcarifer TaxID=8187 RepID=A0A4W6F9P6_LATCA